MSAQTLIKAPLGGAGQLLPPRRWSKLSIGLQSLPFLALHLGCLAVFFFPVTAPALVLCGVFYLVRMFGITAGYHRYFSHRSYKTSRGFQFVLAWLACSSLQKGPLWWAGHHRIHHRNADTPGDPHSPYETTFWWSHVGWILSSEHAGITEEISQEYSRYPELAWLDRYHWVPGLLLGVVCFLVAGWSGVAWGFVVSTVLLYHGTFTINSLSHLIGKRRYVTSDDSRNNWVLALITLGEGWHNNHHHYQSSANQGFFWWEIDISYRVLWLLSKVGLVWELRKPSEKALKHNLIRPAGSRPATAGPGRASMETACP